MTHLAVRVGGQVVAVELTGQVESGKLYLWVDDQAVVARLPRACASPETDGWLVIDDRPCEVEMDSELRWITTESGRHHLEVRDLEDVAVRAIKGNGPVKAPIPGQITRLFVSEGQSVVADQPLCVLEAMKMENEIRAPRTGLVSTLPIAVGSIVARGQLLAEIASGDHTSNEPASRSRPHPTPRDVDPLARHKP